ncbi:MAG: archease [Phycisphaerae bacterium]
MRRTEPTFELFEHTADLGVRVVAPTLAGLVGPAVAGLYATIGELRADATAPVEPWRLALRGDEPALMLRDLLSELLSRFERDAAIATDVVVERFELDELACRAVLRPIDAEASDLCREVKAVTYHELEIRALADGFEATFIVDI